MARSSSSLTPAALGLSGGADSVALFHACLRAERPFVALHFNHGFADENGDEAEAFVRALCAAHGVSLEVGRAAEPWQGKETKEVFARRLRFAFFARVMRAQGLKTLLLAHQADDRAEQLVLRLGRGSGLEGLCSFGAEAPFPGEPGLRIERPLLGCTHAELVAALRAQGQAWVEDCSNNDDTIPRNAIRHWVLPVLPHFVRGANASLDLLREEQAFLEHLAEAAVRVRTRERLELAEGTAHVLARRALRVWLGGLGREQAERLLASPVGGVVQVSGGRRLRRVSELVWQVLVQAASEPEPEPVVLTVPGCYRFGSWVVRVEELETVSGRQAAEGMLLPLPLVVRARCAGDRFCPAGMGGRHRRVQDVLVEMRVPREERGAYPLVCVPSGEIVAVPGFRVAEGVGTGAFGRVVARVLCTRQNTAEPLPEEVEGGCAPGFSSSN